MEKNALCLSLLSGQLKAVALQRGVVTGAYERAEPLDDLAEFPLAVQQAVAQTRCEARRAVLVLAHPRFSKQIVEAPPARGATLERYLRRRVASLKSFDGEAAWSLQPAMPLKNAEGLLLHILPRHTLDQLAAGCAEAGLQLVRVVPSTSVLMEQLKHLPLGEHELALLAAETGRTTTVVVGRRDGQVCLARVLGSNWSRQLDNVVMDLDRTIGFVNQETGLSVTKVWLFGEGAAAHAARVGESLSLPVQVSPVAATPFYWAEQAALLPETEDGNIVSPEARQASQRRSLFAVTALAAILFVFLALTATMYFWRLRYDLEGRAQRTERETAQLEARLHRAEQREAEFQRKQRLLQFIQDETLPPVPGWFLGYVGEVLPEDLVLTQLKVARSGGAWQLRLAGAYQPARQAATAAGFQATVASLTNALATGPFQVAVTRSEIEHSPPTEARAKQFTVEGVMR